MSMRVTGHVLMALTGFLLACSSDTSEPAAGGGAAAGGTGGVGGKADSPSSHHPLNAAAGDMVLYEVQVRTANACRTDLGAQWQRDLCESKPAPASAYRAQGTSCPELAELEQVKLGTLDDMLADTADFRAGITLRYVKEKLGANTLWLMPLFPNNDIWDLPDGCDNLGSPYAVRDYFHARGTLSRDCIQRGGDEYADEPCWANQELDALIEDAHARGLKVMLDIALNHFGHGYMMYDYVDFRPVRELVANGESLESLWNYDQTHDEALVHPKLLDTQDQLAAIASDPAHSEAVHALRSRCPSLQGQELVRAYNMWRVALDSERQQFSCEGFLEHTLPGFYLGSNRWDPATGLADTYTNEWRDVKFLFHQSTNEAHAATYARNREYFFRILNYWVSRGVDGFRLDHAADFASGLAAMEWHYVLRKVNYYAKQRGQQTPVYLAEEFWDQQEIGKVVDVMTEGYVHDMCGREVPTKDASHVEWVLGNMDRFEGKTYVMTALETHDEARLIEGTGFDQRTGAGFWAIGAATWSTPMLLMGQEFGEPWRLSFRRSDLLRARFEGSANHYAGADALLESYQQLIGARLEQQNRALSSQGRAFLRTRHGNTVDPRILAMARWSAEGSALLVFHNLWRQPVSQHYFIATDVATAMGVSDGGMYRLIDALTEQPATACMSGADLKWDVAVDMAADVRQLWLRVETC
jgi:hypothetical protein